MQRMLFSPGHDTHQLVLKWARRDGLKVGVAYTALLVAVCIELADEGSPIKESARAIAYRQGIRRISSCAVPMTPSVRDAVKRLSTYQMRPARLIDALVRLWRDRTIEPPASLRSLVPADVLDQHGREPRAPSGTIIGTIPLGPRVRAKLQTLAAAWSLPETEVMAYLIQSHPSVSFPTLHPLTAAEGSGKVAALASMGPITAVTSARDQG